MELSIEELNEDICPVCKRQYCLGFGLLKAEGLGAVRRISCTECGRTFDEYLKSEKVVLVDE
jgi:hypothetical protein